MKSSKVTKPAVLYMPIFVVGIFWISYNFSESLSEPAMSWHSPKGKNKKELEIPYSSGTKSTKSKCSKNAPIVNVK